MEMVACSTSTEDSLKSEAAYIGEDIENEVAYPVSVEGFVGDTMPFFDDGIYNIFYLCDQRNGKQGYHPWGLIETTNFTKFDDTGVVINYGDSIESQDIALGTGSVIRDEAGIYHAFYTGHNDTFSPKEAVMHATSTDMKNWEKIEEDTFTADSNYSTDDFRDPYVMYSEEDRCYLMFITTRKDNCGVIAKYSSDDLKTWTDEGVFFENDMGNDSNMECPTVLEYKGKWYLSFSDQWPDRQVHYRICDTLNGVYAKPDYDVFDCNGFYAGRMVTDGEKLFVVGWNGTKKNHSDSDEYDWGGNMVTHQLEQNDDGSLSVVLNENIKNLYSNECIFSPQKITDTVETKDDSYRFSGNEYEVVGFKNLMGNYLLKAHISEFDSDGMFGFAFNLNDENVGRLNIVFNVANNRIEFYNNSDIVETKAQSYLEYDFSDVSDLDVSMVISNGVVVMYVNDDIAFTTRMYMSQGMEWGIFSIKSPVVFSDMNLYK